ncbi:MAG: hypothetical protein J6T06_13895, partial [Victivallales bacterium]|nr:hypothetical protein [Victivallales bacterium]
MIEFGMLNAMVASIGVGSWIMAVAALVVGAVISAFIFNKKVEVKSNLAENARKEAEAIKAEAEKDAQMIREKEDLEAEKTRNRAAEQRIAAKEKFDNEV